MTEVEAASAGLSHTTRADHAAPVHRHLGLALVVICVAQLMVVLDASIVNIALPSIQRSLHFSATNLIWVINGYTLAFGGLLLLGGRTGDLFGRRRMFMIGVGIFTVASLLGGMATTEAWLIAARVVQGMGGAIAAPTALALVASTFPEGPPRNRAMGVYAAMSGAGAAIGVLLGGILTSELGWRWVLFVNVPIGIAVYAVGRSVLPETARQHGRFDFAGAFTSTFGMGALVFGFVHAASNGWSDSLTIGSFIVGVVLLASFVAVELRAEEPITPLRLLANASRSGANVARGLVFAGMFGMFFFLTQFLQNVLGYTPLQTGFAFLPIPLTVFASSQLASRVLVQRVNGKVLMLTGVGLSTLGLLLASQLTAHSSYGIILGSLLLFGAGNGLSFVTLTSASLAGVAPADAGAASGLINVTQQLGGTLGVAVLVTVFGSASKHALAHPVAGSSPLELADRVFVYAADRAFVAATLFLVAGLVLVGAAVRAPRTGRAPVQVTPTVDELELVAAEL